MAQIIHFPGTRSAAIEPAAQVAAKSIKREAKASPAFPVVCTIRGRGRIPKKNREEDQDTIMFARLAKGFADRAYALAQTEPNSEQHQLLLHMAGISEKLPRNNLRIFTTPEDVIQGVWWRWQCAKLANAEWELCDHRRFLAAYRRAEDERVYWTKEQEKADRKRWEEYERLVRIPASRLSDVTSYKLDRRFAGPMGNLEWMRVNRPDLAAVVDEELARLKAEKTARQVARAARRKSS